MPFYVTQSALRIFSWELEGLLVPRVFDYMYRISASEFIQVGNPWARRKRQSFHTGYKCRLILPHQQLRWPATFDSLHVKTTLTFFVTYRPKCTKNRISHYTQFER